MLETAWLSGTCGILIRFNSTENLFVRTNNWSVRPSVCRHRHALDGSEVITVSKTHHFTVGWGENCERAQWMWFNYKVFSLLRVCFLGIAKLRPVVLNLFSLGHSRTYTNVCVHGCSHTGNVSVCLRAMTSWWGRDSTHENRLTGSVVDSFVLTSHAIRGKHDKIYEDGSFVNISKWLDSS